MKKRILCMLLALLMAVSLIPAPAFATGEDCGCDLENGGTHAAACPNYVCPDCGNAGWHEVCPESGEGSEEEPGEDTGEEPAEPAVCEVCGNDPCTCETAGEETSYDFSGDVGKLAQLIEAVNSYYVRDGADSSEDSIFYYSDFEEGTIFRITDWYVEPGALGLWYQVEFYSGGVVEGSLEYWVSDPWILYDYLDESYEYEAALVFIPCPVCGEDICIKEHVLCDICGQYDCGLVHLYCEICEAYDCGLEHLFCLACEIYDCPLTHTFCGYCNKYDCGIDHQGMNRPVDTPVIPETPTLTEGADVSIVGEDGAAVTSDGLILAAGKRFSLSAWSDLEAAGADYQWQIRYDEMNDLWVDIQGQNEKGILVSPAMFLSVIEEQGSAAIRCVMTSGDETKTGDAIPVYVVEPVSLTSFASFGARTFASGVMPMAEGDDPGTELEKAYVVVQYVYHDGRTASASDFAEIIAGAAHNHAYQLPQIPGYMPTLNTHSYGERAEIVDNALVLNFAAGDLTDEYTIFTVTYVPDYVRYTVIHYWQNVDDDNYTEHEREVITNQHKTGEKIDDAHKDKGSADDPNPNYDPDYAGLYHLLYDTPTAAADGSTVIEVYYDRYYNLLRFELGENGYGADPIYARVGTPIEVGTPTRAGYTFLGWDLAVTDSDDDEIADTGDGQKDTVPTSMPAENQTYIALWQAADTAKVSVVIWGENPDDEKYSYQKTIQIDAKPGESISWDTLKYDCGLTAHIHSAECGYQCGQEEHAHSLENGCYTLNCTQESHSHDECTLACKHTHDVGCYSTTGDLVETAKPNALPDVVQDGVYTYTEYGVITYYYLKIGEKWYCSDGFLGAMNGITFNCSHSHTDACYTCGKTATTHQHTLDNCYELTCTKTPHAHSDACGYSCGLTAHTHTSDCEVDTEVMDSALWTFVKSDTVTVEADGSTVMNVYYDRTTFTLTFHYNYSNNSYRSTSTITDKWGANIGERFLAVNTSASGNLWSTSTGGGSPWTSYLQIMPQNDEDYYCRYTSTNEQTAEYYTENVDGTYSLAYSVTAYYGSTLSISAEDFYEMEGFTYDHGTDGDGDDMLSPGSYGDFGGAKLYYNRHRYAIEFYNPTTQIRKTTGVAYGVNLGAYHWEPTSDDAPDLYEPGSKKFAGWYLNPECSGEEFILSENTMPSAPEDGATALVLYAKWVGVDCTVSYYLDKDSMERDETIPDEMARLVKEALKAGKITTEPEDTYTEAFQTITVEFGSFIEEHEKPGVSPGYEKIFPYKGYTFVAWFYVDEDGEEKAFDPANMPVKDDLKLYAKWDAGNILCTYNVYFALDENADGVADVDAGGNIIYVAAPITGSGIGGHTYTFTAKGGDELYAAYREGYFPDVGSHSIDIDIADGDGTGANSFTFLYQKRNAVPYTVRYVNAENTNEELLADKVVSDNTNVVVTENFVYIDGYMPDAYQKTLVVTADGSNEIIFYYTKDEAHALYVVNYYIEQLDENLKHAGWLKYTDLQFTGNIGTTYTADAIDIDGFTLSASYTDEYNVTQKKNGMDGTALPAVVSALSENKLSGELAAEGMQLNFYYTRNLYPYEFRYMLSGTATELATAEFGKAGYDTVVTQGAKEIKMDLDGDGINEDYRLYDPAETTKSIHIIVDGSPLSSESVVTKGQATVNVATFYYVRCTQVMTITKDIENHSADNPDPEFTFSLLIHSKNAYHQTSYPFTIADADGTVIGEGTLTPVTSAPNTLQFILKEGQTITIEELPTAEYTITELNQPEGYTDISGTNVRHKLTVDTQLDITVVNTYLPTVTYHSNYPGDVEALPYSERTDYGKDYVIRTDVFDVPTGYRFIGWNTEKNGGGTAYTGGTTYKGSTDLTLYAQWEILTYTVTFVDEDGTTILKEATEYEYGTPAANIVKPDDPTKDSTAQYDYTFAGWTPVISDVTGDATYKATYTETLRKYTVTWKNEDGTVLETDENVEYGTIPTYDGSTPTKAETTEKTYTFKEWTPAISEVTGDVTYTATFTEAPRKYKVTFVDEDGTTVLKEAMEYDYGTPAENIVRPAEPTKDQDSNGSTYSFAGWEPEIVDVTGDAVYKAVYTMDTADFTITINRADAKEGEVFVYRVEGNDLSIDVTIQVDETGSGSVTIADLPTGTYTVTQLNDWSWRYSDAAQTVVHTKDSGSTIAVEFNSSGISRWLSGVSNFLKNIFGVSHGGAG